MNGNRIPEELVPDAMRRNLAANRTIHLPVNLAANVPAAGAMRRPAIGAASVSTLPSILPPILPPILPQRRTPPVKLPGRSVPRLPREYPRPAYSERFHCIASQCEDTCCKDWQVPIDRATYEKYRSVEALKPHLGTLIVLNTNQLTSMDYARIPLSTHQKCTFLDGEQLCGIQRQFGTEMLSVTCKTYPRAMLNSGGQQESALNISCPEAARVTLLAPDLLRECDSNVAGRADRYAALRRDARHLPRQYQPRLAVREFALLQLTDRSYPLWQRLYLLDILARRLDALSGDASVATWAAANPVAVSILLSNSARVAELQLLRPAMDEIQAQSSEQLSLLIELVRMRVSVPPVPTRFFECVQAFEAGLGCATAQNEQQILDAYAEGYRRYYRPLMEQHPHLLENYLMNHVFKNSYPFGRERPASAAPGPAPDAEREHLSMCVHAALAQTLLIGMAGHYRESFGLEHVVKLVQSLARAIEHSKQFLDQIDVYLREKNLNHPRGIALLLRQNG
jgi:lysine-N-methylase